MRYRFMTLLALLLSISVTQPTMAQDRFEPIKGLSVGKSGDFAVNNVQFRLQHFGKNWKMTGQYHNSIVPDSGRPDQSGDSWAIRGLFSGFHLEQKVQRTSESAISYTASLSSEAPVYTESIGLLATLSLEQFSGAVLIIDGKQLQIPSKMNSATLLHADGIRKLEIPDPDGRIIVEGVFSLHIQDERKFGAEEIGIRILANPATGELTKTGISLSIAIVPYDMHTISLRDVANIAFRDDVAEDKQGGWTDQGQNDLRMFPGGKIRLCGVSFDIPASEGNRGKSCLAFAGPSRPYYLQSVRLPVDNQQGTSLYLLHSIAWAPKKVDTIGTVVVEYADGSSQCIEVKAKQDVGDWWGPSRLPNGDVAWIGENPSSAVGLYLSRFPLQQKSITGISFSGTQRAVWLIAGVSMGDRVPAKSNTTVTMTADSNWRSCELPTHSEDGSALDWSFLQNAPAGRHGPVVVRNGHFSFRDLPAETVRFYGANLCFNAQFQDKPQCDQLVRQLIRMGYNTLRLHHYDHIISKEAGDGKVALNAEKMDQLDYLFSECRKNGIYLSIDLYTYRPVRRANISSAESGEEFLSPNEFKALVAIDPAAFENWKSFTETLLRHINPYTGLAWKDDPTLFSLCLVNEGNLNALWPNAPKAYNKAFVDWLSQKGHENTTDPQDRRRKMREFVSECQLNFDRRAGQFVRSLQTHALMTDVNMQILPELGLTRQTLDYTDNHDYWDHPRFMEKDWGMPAVFHRRSAINCSAPTPRQMAPTRIIGRPFTITEYNYCFPNPYRSEGGPLMGAYAALQDWDLVHRFAYAHRSSYTLEDSPSTILDIATDPIGILSDRIAVMLFRRGDVKPARTTIPFALSSAYFLDDAAAAEIPSDAQRIGLIAKTGTLASAKDAADGTIPALLTIGKPIEDLRAFRPLINAQQNPIPELIQMGALPRACFDENSGRITSDTGEIELNPKMGTLRIVTPRSECFVAPANSQLSGTILSVKNGDSFGTLSLHSLDNRPLSESARMILFHLSDSTNSGLRFRDSDMNIVEKMGGLPHLVKAAKAEITLKLPEANYELWALNLAGKRVFSIPLVKANGGRNFMASTITDSGVCFIYELVRQ